MKRIITSLAVLAIVAFTQFAKAQTQPTKFIVSPGQSFSLAPQGDGILSKLFWRIDNNTESQIINWTAQTKGALVTSFANATTQIVTHQIRLSVVEILDGCQSDETLFEVVVLPQLQLALETVEKTAFCVGKAVDITLKGVQPVIAGLDELGITIPLHWVDANGTTVSTTKDLLVPAAGTYSLVGNYVIPTVLQPVTKIAASLITGVSQEIKATPLPSVPTISLF